MSRLSEYVNNRILGGTIPTVRGAAASFRQTTEEVYQDALGSLEVTILSPGGNIAMGRCYLVPDAEVLALEGGMLYDLVTNFITVSPGLTNVQTGLPWGQLEDGTPEEEAEDEDFLPSGDEDSADNVFGPADDEGIINEYSPADNLGEGPEQATAAVEGGMAEQPEELPEPWQGPGEIGLPPEGVLQEQGHDHWSTHLANPAQVNAAWEYFNELGLAVSKEDINVKHPFHLPTKYFVPWLTEVLAKREGWALQDSDLVNLSPIKTVMRTQEPGLSGKWFFRLCGGEGGFGPPLKPQYQVFRDKYLKFVWGKTADTYLEDAMALRKNRKDKEN